MAHVVLENLGKIFNGAAGAPVRAVDHVNLSVEDKELLVLVGPSGCGKTTLLRLMAGLEDASQGTITIDGQLMNHLPPQAREVAMVFQNHALYPHMTAAENLSFPLRLRQFPAAEIQRRVSETAQMLGLTSCLGRLPKEISGGQRQRVALGRAMVRQPKIFLLDEPLSNLDTPMRVQMRRELVRLHARLGATMIYVTHDQVEALAMGTRVAVMDQGHILQVAEPRTLYRQPVNKFVAGFIGSPSMNFFDGTLQARPDGVYFCQAAVSESSNDRPLRFKLLPQQAADCAVHIGKSVVFGLRPEHLMSLLPGAESKPDTAINARIENIERLGADTYLHLCMGGQELVARAPVEDFSPQAEITLRLEVGHGHFFDATAGARLSQSDPHHNLS